MGIDGSVVVICGYRRESYVRCPPCRESAPPSLEISDPVSHHQIGVTKISLIILAYCTENI
jgi:hypothetical protein